MLTLPSANCGGTSAGAAEPGVVPSADAGSVSAAAVSTGGICSWNGGGETDVGLRPRGEDAEREGAGEPATELAR